MISKKIFSLILCACSLCSYAQTKKAKGSDVSAVPSAALEGQLERRSFEMRGQEQREYDVYSESDFDRIDYRNDVVINLRADITLSEPLSIKSKKTVQIEGNGHAISDGWRKPAVSCSEVYQAKSWTYDEKTQLCTMTLPEELKGLKIEEKDSVLIAYELWFVRQLDKVVSARDGKLTFYCQQHYKPTQKTRKAWTSRPMMYLMYPSEAQFKNGGASAMMQYNTSFLVRIAKGTRVKMHDVKIEDCPGGAVSSDGELYVNACAFNNVDGSCIRVGNRSYADVTDSQFKCCGLKGSNDACVKGAGNIYVGNCTFEDFNYSAILVGRGSTTKEDDLCSVTLENNTLEWTADWQKEIKKYGLKDSGAIYVATNNRRVIIRQNSITNYGGHGKNRAIFCDDGSYNVTIYDNKIERTQNAYDIDLRDCSQKPIRKVPQGHAMNTNNYVLNNTCSGEVRLQASSVVADHGCVFRDNRQRTTDNGL